MTKPSGEMLSKVDFLEWFTDHWMRAGLVMAVVLLTITPIFFSTMPWILILVYLQLPMYMIHQYEEHAQGAFQRYTTAQMGHGRMVLNARAILWINVGLVWAADLVFLLLATFVNPVWGMVAVALPVVNGILHLVSALRERTYNPGLWTSLLLFLPFGIYALLTIGDAVNASVVTFALVLLGGVLLHAPIILFVRQQLRASA